MMPSFLRKASLVTLLGAGLSLNSYNSYAQRGGNFLGFTSGQNDQVMVPNFTLPAAGPFSLEAWVYYNSSSFAAAGSYNTVIEFGNDDPWFGVNSSGQVEFYSGLEGGTLPLRTWAHIAYTWNGTTGTIYLNGTAVATSTDTPDRLGSGMGIGYNTSDTGWHGYIDEVMVWSTARTPAQILSDQTTGPGATPTGLLAYFKFDEASGQTVINQANAAMNGVLGTTNATQTNDPVRTNVVMSSRGPVPMTTAQLHANYPNPFAATTTIPFELRRAAHVRLRVLDLTGREVVTLVDEPRLAGTYTVPFQPRKLAAGVYVSQLTIDGQSVSQRMLVE